MRRAQASFLENAALIAGESDAGGRQAAPDWRARRAADPSLDFFPDHPNANAPMSRNRMDNIGIRRRRDAPPPALGLDDGLAIVANLENISLKMRSARYDFKVQHVIFGQLRRRLFIGFQGLKEIELQTFGDLGRGKKHIPFAHHSASKELEFDFSSVP
jgi:hypothetical protein